MVGTQTLRSPTGDLRLRHQNMLGIQLIRKEAADHRPHGRFSLWADKHLSIQRAYLASQCDQLFWDDAKGYDGRRGGHQAAVAGDRVEAHGELLLPEVVELDLPEPGDCGNPFLEGLGLNTGGRENDCSVTGGDRGAPDAGDHEEGHR